MEADGIWRPGPLGVSRPIWYKTDLAPDSVSHSRDHELAACAARAVRQSCSNCIGLA